jgi:hypothetical protein
MTSSAFSVFQEVVESEAQDAQVLCIAVRPDEQQWRIIHFTLNDLLKYKKKTHREKISA